MKSGRTFPGGLAKGLENKGIAASVGRSESVVSREIAAHGGREAYRAWKADAAARESRSRPKERKIDTEPELRELPVPRSAPGSPATDGNSNPNRYAPPTAKD